MQPAQHAYTNNITSAVNGRHEAALDGPPAYHSVVGTGNNNERARGGWGFGKGSWGSKGGGEDVEALRMAFEAGRISGREERMEGKA